MDIINNVVVDIIDAAGMGETYGTYVDDECFDIHDYDDDTDHDTDDGGHGNRSSLLGGAELIS